MTNTEYEAACITATKCYDRFEGEHRLKQYDEMIAQVEKTLARLQEERRELVNRYDLNKINCMVCKHAITQDYKDWGECGFCGSEL